MTSFIREMFSYTVGQFILLPLSVDDELTDEYLYSVFVYF